MSAEQPSGQPQLSLTRSRYVMCVGAPRCALHDATSKYIRPVLTTSSSVIRHRAGMRSRYRRWYWLVYRRYWLVYWSTGDTDWCNNWLQNAMYYVVAVFSNKYSSRPAPSSSSSSHAVGCARIAVWEEYWNQRFMLLRFVVWILCVISSCFWFLTITHATLSDGKWNNHNNNNNTYERSTNFH